MQVFLKLVKQSAKKSVLFILLISLLVGCEQEIEVETAEPVQIVNYDDFGIPIDSFNVETGVVKKNETLGEILSGSGIDYSLVNDIYTTSKPYP